MQTTPAIDHEARPLACFNHLYRDLPRLFATGGTQAEVDALFGGLSPALQGALGVTPGASVGLRLFAEPWGWAPEAGPPVDVDRAALALDVAAPCFTFGEWSGALLVPDGDGGWQRWSPVDGPAPKPADGHMRVLVALSREAGDQPTLCRFREVYGRDRGFDAPLYKPSVSLAPASPSESHHLMITLRSLLATGKAA